MSKRKSYWDYKKIFEQFKGNHKVFIETGTHQGDSVLDALDLGYDKIYSVEINKKFYDTSVGKVNQYYPKAIESGRVVLKLGDSREWFPIFINMIGDQSAFFWLDSHHGGDVPTSFELNTIIESGYKHHTIAIDDIDLHVMESSMDIYCKDINSKYKTELFEGITPSKQKVYYV